MPAKSLLSGHVKQSKDQKTALKAAELIRDRQTARQSDIVTICRMFNANIPNKPADNADSVKTEYAETIAGMTAERDRLLNIVWEDAKAAAEQIGTTVAILQQTDLKCDFAFNGKGKQFSGTGGHTVEKLTARAVTLADGGNILARNVG